MSPERKGMNADTVAAAGMPRVECPFCSMSLDLFAPRHRQAHVLSCENERLEERSLGQSASSSDEAQAGESIAECIVCGLSLENMPFEMRMQHVNLCLDANDNTAASRPGRLMEEMRRAKAQHDKSTQGDRVLNAWLCALGLGRYMAQFSLHRHARELMHCLPEFEQLLDSMKLPKAARKRILDARPSMLLLQTAMQRSKQASVQDPVDLHLEEALSTDAGDAAPSSDDELVFVSLTQPFNCSPKVGRRVADGFAHLSGAMKKPQVAQTGLNAHRGDEVIDLDNSCEQHVVHPCTAHVDSNQHTLAKRRVEGMSSEDEDDLLRTPAFCRGLINKRARSPINHIREFNVDSPENSEVALRSRLFDSESRDEHDNLLEQEEERTTSSPERPLFPSTLPLPLETDSYGFDVPSDEERHELILTQCSPSDGDEVAPSAVDCANEGSVARLNGICSEYKQRCISQTLSELARVYEQIAGGGMVDLGLLRDQLREAPQRPLDVSFRTLAEYLRLEGVLFFDKRKTGRQWNAHEDGE
ncbi:hypothetical protein FVE85_9514 [Porphyridium purpureum]|uniref:Uncharacterized protein n=1 Tax=Porphyridium purpureum TaxID=35688 RepID=A0A5J4YIK6_PORPP|nr:hypothetical protein FVE85_9514 [Porphyridium purpureum]|eukprot:POR7950..scf261_15